MSKYILGSGLTGLAARHILGDDWKLIPFGRSRFYSTRPVLGDNFIVRSDEMDRILPGLEFMPKARPFKRAFSMAGQLIFSEQSFAKEAYLNKLFGEYPHPAASVLTKTELDVYTTPTVEFYLALLARYTDEIRESTATHGKVVAITDHHIKTEKSDLEFSRIVSTIPFYALMRYLGKDIQVPSRNIWYYHVKTPAVNLEGAREALVADDFIDFYKATYVGPQEYLFHCIREIVTQDAYFSAFLGNRFEILNHTSMFNAVPLGVPPKLDDLEAADIYPIGDQGQWDYFMDISSSVNRIRKVSNLSDR